MGDGKGVERGISPQEAEEIGRILEKVGKRGPEPGSGGSAIGRWDPDSPGCRRSMIIAVALIVALFVLIFALCSGEDAVEVSTGDDITTELPVESSSTSSTSSSTKAPEPQPEPEPEPVSGPATTGDEVLDGILAVLGVAPEDEAAVKPIADDLEDLIDSIREILPAYQGRDVDIKRVIMMLLEGYEANPISSIRQIPAAFECGGTDPLVVCSDMVLDVPAGDLLIVAMEVDEAMPVASPDRSYVYAIVFDSDGAPENNWVFNPPFDFDFFQGTDLWYEAVYDHTTGGWGILLTQLNPDGSYPAELSPTAARVVIDGSWAVWFIPTSELVIYPAPLRVTAFGHDGLFSEDSRGGDVLGPDPTGPLGLPIVGTAVMTDG